MEQRLCYRVVDRLFPLYSTYTLTATRVVNAVAGHIRCTSTERARIMEWLDRHPDLRRMRLAGRGQPSRYFRVSWTMLGKAAAR
jgi:hypothetical protein